MASLALGSTELNGELATLMAQIQDIESRLQALTGGQVDAVLAPTGRTHLLAQAQQRLMASEDEQRRTAIVQTAVINALPAHVALLDASGRIVSVNEAWKRFGGANGLADANFGVGADYTSFCEPVDGPAAPGMPEAAGGVRAVLAGEASSFTLEYSCHSPAGQHWYRMMVTPLDESRPAGAVVMHVDISERVRAERALRDSEQRYRGIVDMLPDLVLTAAGDRITFINRSGLRLLRATDASQVIGLPPLALFAAKGSTELRRGLLGQDVQDEPAQFGDDRLVALDGSLLDVEVAASSYLADGERILQVVCRDLIERRRAELQQQQLAERLTLTLDSLTDGFVAVDRDWRITYLNPLAERMLARSVTELLGQVVWSAFPVLGDTAIAQALRHAMDGQCAVQVVEHLLPVKRWFDLRIYGSARGLTVYARDVTRERRLAAQLEEERLRLVQAQEVSRMGSWSADLLTGEVVWSAETHRIFETDVDTFLPTRPGVLAVVHPDDRIAVEAALRASFDRETPQTIEHRLQFADGRVKFVEERWRIFRAPDGRPLRAMGTCQDITERKQADQLLRRSQSMVQLAGHMARLGAWSVDLASRVVRWSDVVAAIHEEPEGRSPSIEDGISYYAPEHRETVRTHFVRCVEAGVPFDLELQIVTARGRRRWVRVIGQAERDDAGRIVSVQGAFQDISERKAAEVASRELADRLQTTLESITDGFVTFDAQWNITYVNQRAEQLFSRQRGRLLGRHVWTEFPAEVGGVIHRQLERAVRESVAVAFEYHSRALHRWFEADAYPTARGLAVYFREITERKKDQDALRRLNAELEARVLSRTAELSRARAEAEKANQAKSAILATMSHEIRTPMNGVIGMVDVLCQTSLKGYQVEMVDLIRDSAHSLLRIIEDILDFSKIEAGRMDIDPAPLSLADLVESVCSMLDHMASRRNVGIAIFVDPDIPPLLMGDEARLRQVLVNLVGNAIKFSGGGSQRGHVSVRAHLLTADDRGATVELRVADNGIGMDEATMARLFTPFSQADVSTTRRFGGTGLGLAISGALVELMGGKIAVRSALGSGATFDVQLALARAEDTLPATPALQQAADAVAGLHCCIVTGDDGPLADDLAASLSHAGVVVERAELPGPTLAAPLWLVLPTQVAAGIERLRALAPPGGRTRFVLLGSGHRRRPRLEAPDLVRIDVCGLTRRALFRVLALAAGRLAEESFDSDPGEQPMLTAAAASHRGLALRGGRILVAEDNETNRKVIRQQLHLIGLKADFAEDGQRALELWRKDGHGLVFTDLHMPRMDGYALTAAIRAEERSRGERRIAIVALTANALRDEEARCRAAGMDAYLSKPVRLARLQSVLDECLPVPVAPPPVDLEVLKALVGDDEAVIESVLKAFLESADQCSAALARASAHGELRGVTDAAHKLKSGARSIGALQLGDRCRDLEVAAEAGRPEAVAHQMQLFDAELRAVFDWLEKR